MNVGSAFTGNEEVEATLNELSAAMFVGADTANLTTGRIRGRPLRRQCRRFESGLASSLTQVSGRLSQLGALIVTDPGKLLAFRTGSQYGFNGSSAADNAITPGAPQFAWQSLLPAAYEAVRLVRNNQNAGVQNADQYVCTQINVGRVPPVQYEPFAAAPQSAQLPTPSCLFSRSRAQAFPTTALSR